MDRDFWVKQAADKPLYGDLIWSRPENAAYAGKLLIVGGNLHGFNNPAMAYTEAGKAGIGVARVLLPDALQKTVGKVFEAGEYAPSTPSGSFSQRALGELVPMAAWADATMLSGDFGRNSETAILLEKFASSYAGQLTVACDAADYFTSLPMALLGRPDTLWVISFAQLQKLGIQSRHTTAFTHEMDIFHLVDALHEFSQLHDTHIITKHHDTIFAASQGKVSSTRLLRDMGTWRLRTAVHAAVWWLQTPAKPLEALTTGIVSMLGKTS